MLADAEDLYFTARSRVDHRQSCVLDAQIVKRRAVRGTRCIQIFSIAAGGQPMAIGQRQLDLLLKA